jgi:hypothetical protein
MGTKRVTEDMRQQLCKPLPSEAVTPHPTKKYLSSIKSIYVTERLNEVFGVGSWKVKTEVIDNSSKMIVCKVTLSIPEYGIEYECFGGNDNADLGDAYKGASTDALTKIASWMGIGGEVFRGEVGKTTANTTTNTPKRKTLTLDKIMDEAFLKTLCEWLNKNTQGNNLDTFIRSYYDCDNETMNCITKEYNRIYA